MSNNLARRTDPLPDDAPHILVVDDDQKIRDLLGRYLFENGFRVTTAGDTTNARAVASPLAQKPKTASQGSRSASTTT